MAHTPDLTAPAIGISLTHTVAENRNIVLQAFIPADCSDADFNALLDKCFRASARQEAVANLPKLRQRLENETKMLTRATEDIFRLDNEALIAEGIADDAHKASGKRGERTPTAAQRQDEARRQQDRASAKTTVERYKNDIARLAEEIAALELLVAPPPEG